MDLLDSLFAGSLAIGITSAISFHRGIRFVQKEIQRDFSIVKEIVGDDITLPSPPSYLDYTKNISKGNFSFAGDYLKELGNRLSFCTAFCRTGKYYKIEANKIKFIFN